MNKDRLDYKKKYDLARHHAWAGGILLSVLLAIRLLFNVDFAIIIVIGSILIIYILTALFLTYRYHSGITTEQKSFQEIHIKTDSTELEKQRLKIEKKKAKTEAKKAKKSNKN